MSLVSLDNAKNHLQITTPDSLNDPMNVDLRVKLTQAEAIVLDYLKTYPTNDDGSLVWDELTVPGMVQAAILLQLAELWRFRGDDTDGPSYLNGELAPPIANLLRRYRDPALA